MNEATRRVVVPFTTAPSRLLWLSSQLPPRVCNWVQPGRHLSVDQGSKPRYSPSPARSFLGLQFRGPTLNFCREAVGRPPQGSDDWTAGQMAGNWTGTKVDSVLNKRLEKRREKGGKRWEMKKCSVKWMSRDIFQISQPFPVRDLLLQD